MRNLLLSVLFVLLAGTLSPARGRSLSIVTLYSPPMAYEVNKHVVGIATDIVREALKRMNITANITIMPWKRAIFMTRFGEADALFYAVRSQERKMWFHFPNEPLVEEATVALRRTSFPVTIAPDKQNYRKYTLGIGRGFYYGPRIADFLQKAQFKKVEKAATIDQNFNKLIEGRVDVIFADLHLANYFLAKRSMRKLIEIVTDDMGAPVIFDSVNTYLAFSKETVPPSLATEFSNTLKVMKKDGTYDRIFALYR